MRKEYLLLFNAMTDLLAELQALQLWAMGAGRQTAALADEETGPMQAAFFRQLLSRLQTLQLSIVVAQQQAEELYLEGEE